MEKFLASSSYSFPYDNEECRGQYEYIFNTRQDIFKQMITDINHYRADGEYWMTYPPLEEYGLKAIFDEHPDNNKNYQHFSIFKYINYDDGSEQHYETGGDWYIYIREIDVPEQE